MDLASTPSTTWGQERRLQFIDFRLRWEGRVNRGDLTRFFEISIPQASADLARYLDRAPENARYDATAKAYLPTDQFKPISERSSSARYLTDLLSRHHHDLEQGGSFVGWAPPLASIPRVGRHLDSDILAEVVRAVRDRRALTIAYQSMSRPQPRARDVSVHALAFDGSRWHARAYCHLEQGFRDFVVARVLSATTSDAAYVDAQADAHWHRLLAVELIANPRLSVERRRLIEQDFDMYEGVRLIPCRQAMLYYSLRALRLDEPESTAPEAQQVVARNLEQLKPYLAAVTPRSRQSDRDVSNDTAGPTSGDPSVAGL